jgi:hypothetical protein
MESLRDDDRSGRSGDFITPEITEKVKEALVENVWLTKKELSKMFKLSIVDTFNILRHELNMTKVSVSWVLRMLTPYQ